MAPPVTFDPSLYSLASAPCFINRGSARVPVTIRVRQCVNRPGTGKGLRAGSLEKQHLRRGLSGGLRDSAGQSQARGVRRDSAAVFTEVPLGSPN